MPDDALKDLADYIAEKQENSVSSYEFFNDELVLNASAENIIDLLNFLRDDKECKFHILLDVCGVDFPERDKRFDVVYILLSMRHNHRVRVKVPVADGELVPSIVGLYSAAGWFEREVWDMYGVLFAGNPDLRRILTDYGFEGHPQRKDFPLTGHVELRYDEELKRVVYEPVELTQDFRGFDYTSPWEAMTGVQMPEVLPGDEKAKAGEGTPRHAPPHGWKSSAGG